MADCWRSRSMRIGLSCPPKVTAMDDRSPSLRAWSEILARYREPNSARSIVEIVITVLPLALLWLLMWISLDIG
jgi:acyl-lipid omega-6 desaturase (Delta-12 desaturase)